MDPHAFDQSLQKTSPKMNPAVRLMILRQGTRSIEEYVADFLELAHLTRLEELCLMIFFRGGLSEPLSSIMPLHEATGTLEEYSDLALRLSGSPFTVGVAEEENLPPIGTSTSEPCHKMAADPESHNSPAKPEYAHIVNSILCFCSHLASISQRCHLIYKIRQTADPDQSTNKLVCPV